MFKTLARAAGEEVPQDSSTPLPSKGELYIHEFDERGLASRTEFSEHDSTLYKSRTTRYGANHGFGLTELSRPISSNEANDLRLVIIAPESHLIAIDGLTKLTKKDKRAVEEAHKEYDERKRKYRERLENIDRSLAYPLFPIESSDTAY